MVRSPSGPFFRGAVAQFGRAPALQAGSQEFNPPRLHSFTEMILFDVEDLAKQYECGQ